MVRSFDKILFTSAEFAGHIRFWEQQLTSSEDAFRLADPLSGPAAPVAGGGARRSVALRLDPDVRARVDALVRGDELGVVTVVAAALALVLARHADREVVVFRTPRLRGAGAQRYLGTDEVPLVQRVPGAWSVRELLLETRRTVLSSYEHQDLPLAFLAAERGLSLAGCTTNVSLAHASLHEPPGAAAAADLAIVLSRAGGELELAFDHDSAVLRDAFVEAFGRRLERVLAAFADVSRPLAEISMLSEEERRTVLHTFNATATAYPRDRSIVELFEERARRAPEATALAFGSRSWTYERLNRAANRLARFLKESFEITADDRVGVMMHRSDLVILSLLSILKAGGAYVPLDASYPDERIQTMVRDAAPKALLIHSDFIDKLILCDVPLVAVDLQLDALPPDDEDLPDKPRPDQLAYVMYTSGSTGVPKGVMVEHRPVVRLTRETNFFQVAPEDRFLQLGSLSFDASTLEIWGPLLNGASLHMTTQDVIGSPHRLAALLAEARITAVCITTSLFNQLVDIDPTMFAPLRCAIVGGEKISPLHVNAARRACPDLCVINGYGPTENTTYTACYAVAEAWNGDIPLGRPIANTRVYVVGLHGDPKPVGVIGEICAAGDGLARGYLGSPELTEARFVPNLFEPGERMYRTGDLGYLRADGALAYAGRRDAQVKVRGFRVELGEIEAALARHPDARQAVVLARPGAGGTNELAAYVAGVAAEDPSALRRFLADILPDYMVPAEIIALDGLPLTPNGKVDRAALGALRASAAPREEVADAAGPRSAIEEKLCEIWRDVLQVPSLGITDDFFELGGHSLVATRIVSRVYRDLSAEINISDIFLNPTIEQLAAVIEGAARAADAGELRPVEPQPFYPLSRAQQRMWVLHQLDPRGVIYNIARAYLLDGPLDLDAFRRAIRALVARHEALRTTFAVVDGAPAQRVHEELPFEIREIDLRGEPHAEERVRAVFFADAQTPFDLERGPLFRVHLLRLEERRHVQCFNIHHVLIDVWSTNILFDDLIALYNAFARGDPDPLAPLPLQYKDFAAWQRRFERTEAFRQQRRYWHAELAGELPTLELPTDRPRPRVKTWHGALQRFELSPEQSEAVRALSHEESSSVFITMLAVFKVLLYRLSGQDDILVGTPVVDRPDEVLERQVGLYLNTIVLRSRLSGEEPFRAFLARLTRAVLETYDNKSYPFDLLADELVPERDASRNPLFDVLVIGYNLPETKGGLRGVEMRPLHYDRELDRSQFDLTIDFEDRDVIFGELEYNTDLFDAATIERMLGHFQVLLAGALASPDRCIAELSLLTGIERQLLVEGYNATAAVLDGAPVHQRIAAQADRTPQATAVVFEGARLTYRELDRRANQLAHHLRRFGVGPDVPVAVCLDRSIEMVIALLGILKAGGAYLPLDPSYPKGRLQFMVADAGAAVLITEERLADRLYLSTRHVVRIDRAWAAIGRESESPPHVPLSEQNLVHVIYTSGSTGKPKGVMSTHGGLRNRLLWGQATYPLSLEDRVLQKTPFGFDVSVWELFWPLLTGAILVMARPGGHQDPSYLVRTLVEERITTVHFVPSMLRAFLDDPDVERCRSVRQVFCSGEALPYELQERYFARLEAPLYNLYGPTEASIEVSHWTCQRRGERQIVPIGRPIANAQLHVLDALMQPAPIGVAGELYLGGAGLARGYIGRPDLTAERFVPDPFGPPGARLYRSGDRARRLPDGAIEYLGRLDDQIKIRGLRIELGEIASALMDQAGVRDAVVVARGERLVAYVVLDEAAAPVEELKRALKERLPGYMVPPSFVVMRELPRTPSGKIDRKALPEPDGESDGAAAYVAPRTPPEQMLTGMIADALGRERIGIDDDFFERGGHSLKAMSLLLRLRERLDCPISLVDLYDHPTARTLAAWVEERRAATG